MQQGGFQKRGGPTASEQSLSGSALLAAWERGAAETPSARALTLLRVGCPALAEEEAAALPLTLRDHALVSLHARSFGPTFSAFVTCGSCGERLEFTLPAQ